MKTTYLVFSGVMVLVGFLLVFASVDIYNISYLIGEPILFGFVPVLIYFSVSYFLNESKILFQYKLFNYYLIVSLFLILLTPSDCNAPLGICVNQSMLSLFLSIIFILISIIYFIIQFFKNKKNNEKFY